LTPDKSYIEQIHELCRIPQQYEATSISIDLKWDIRYAKGEDWNFTTETDLILESHTVLFPNRIKENPCFIKHPWIFLQHEYSHAFLAERSNGFGIYEFNGNPNPNFRDKTLLAYLDWIMNEVADWFTDAIVAKRFPVPFRDAHRAFYNDCIGTFEKTLENFTYDLFYALALAQADFYAFNLRAILPNKSQITNYLKYAFLRHNPNKPSNEAVAETVNGILSIMMKSGIVGIPLSISVVNKTLLRAGKSKNVNILDFKIGNSSRSE
jgi:hypothetical protein